MAQLGFIVITVGHRGDTPMRGKAYHRYGYGNMRDYPLQMINMQSNSWLNATRLSMARK